MGGLRAGNLEAELATLPRVLDDAGITTAVEGTLADTDPRHRVLLAWVLRGADWVRAAGWGAFGLLIATAWMVPWYLIWLLPLTAVYRDRVLVGATVALTACQAINAVPL